MAGIEAVGLGPLLATLQSFGFRRLCKVRLEPSPLKLLDDVAPAGGRFQRDSRLLAGEALDKTLQPLSKALPVGWLYLAAMYLAALQLDVVEGDLLPMHVETTYNVHFRGLLKLRYLHDTGVWSRTARVCAGEASFHGASPCSGLFMSSFDLRTYEEECALRVILFCETPSASPGAWILGWKRCLHCSFSR